MKIKIKSIEAVIVDISTHDEDSFIIKNWEVEYEVLIASATLQGKLGVTTPDENINTIEIDKILDYIRKMYVSAEDVILNGIKDEKNCF